MASRTRRAGMDMGSDNISATALQDLIGRRLFHDAAQRRWPAAGLVARTGQPEWIHDKCIR